MNDKLSQTELQAIQAVFSGGSELYSANSVDALTETLGAIFHERLGYKVDLYFIDSEALDDDIKNINLEISNKVNRELLSKEYSHKAYNSDADATDLEKQLFLKVQNNVSKAVSNASSLLSQLEGNETATLYRFNFEDNVIKLSVPSNYFVEKEALAVENQAVESVAIESPTARVDMTEPVNFTKLNIVPQLGVDSEKTLQSKPISLTEKIDIDLALHITDLVVKALVDNGSVIIDSDQISIIENQIYQALEVSAEKKGA